MMDARKTLINKVIVALTLFVLLLMARSIGAQSQDLDYVRYDVEITLHADGTFTVREIQHLRFYDSFRTGFAEIPLDMVGSIENVQVSGGDTLDTVAPYAPGSGSPWTYSVTRERDNLLVSWEYFATTYGDEKVFVVQYDVTDGLWVYPDVHRLEWRAVAADRSGLDVPASQVTVHLPFTLSPDEVQIEAFGPAYETAVIPTATGQQITFTATEPLPDGTPFQVLVDFPPDRVPATLQDWQIDEDTADLAYTLDRIDVAMTLDENGRLTVSEQQQVTVLAGVMYTGYRDFSLLYVDDLQLTGVAEGERPFSRSDGPLSDCTDCYTLDTRPKFDSWVAPAASLDEIRITERSAGSVDVAWRFPALVRGESTTFTLDYVVDGAVRVDEAQQTISWTAVPAYDAPVEAATVRLDLPRQMGLEDVTVSGADVQRGDDGTIWLTPTAPIAADTPWHFTLTLPPDATTAAKPAWQQDIEAALVELQALQTRQARIDLAWAVGRIAAGVVVILGVVTGWYLWGSRKVRERLGNYRTLPPSDLPPGLVAYLVDGEPTARGALASLLYLANLGRIRVDAADGLTLTRTASADDNDALPAHAQVLLDGLQSALPPGKLVPFADVLPALRRTLPDLYAAMAEEMVTHFYGRHGGVWRQRLAPLLMVVWFIGTAGFLIWYTRSFRFGGAFPWPIPVVLFGGLFATAAIVRRLTQQQAALTTLGQREAARWRGFRAYLQDMQRVGDLVEAQEILERYFAYAVALGVDQSLLAQAQTLGARRPGWLGDDDRTQPGLPRRPFPRWRRAVRRGAWLPRAPKSEMGGGGTAVAPDGSGLQGVSDSLSQAISQASGRLTESLNTAVGDGPIAVSVSGAGQNTRIEFDADTPVSQMMDEIMSKSQSIRPPRPTSGSGRGGYRGGSGGFGGGRRSGGSRSRSSSSRRSGGGGRRGFGR